MSTWFMNDPHRRGKFTKNFRPLSSLTSYSHEKSFHITTGPDSNFQLMINLKRCFIVLRISPFFKINAYRIYKLSNLESSQQTSLKTKLIEQLYFPYKIVS